MLWNYSNESAGKFQPRFGLFREVRNSFSGETIRSQTGGNPRGELPVLFATAGEICVRQTGSGS